jgi:hypothetical protein
MGWQQAVCVANLLGACCGMLLLWPLPFIVSFLMLHLMPCITRLNIIIVGDALNG